MEPQNQDVGRKLFLFTIAMFTLPVMVFFAFRTHVFGAGADMLGALCGEIACLWGPRLAASMDVFFFGALPCLALP